MSATTVEEKEDIYIKSNNLSKLVRIIAYCKRFIHNYRSEEIITGTQTIQETDEALEIIIRNDQTIHFKEEIERYA